MAKSDWITIITQRGIQQQLSSYRETVIRQASAATGSAVHRDDAPTCGICHKTKFADGCGNLCSYCQTKFCARCGGRVSLRSNTWYKKPKPTYGLNAAVSGPVSDQASGVGAQSYSTLPATSKTSHPNESRQNVTMHAMQGNNQDQREVM
ncbi:unnamed protein product [Pleuronectes platessa]|uniref:RIM zinc finger domain-containing protein n=1 Tax=Pleuronectes platessa TaxID=8262 RepID=A0A9N7U794_PLEPL|nr:unnamed protein product [Pleuronectes platessa]